MRRINGVVPNRTFSRSFLESPRLVEHKAEGIRRELTYRAAWDHPNPAYRAERGELENMQRAYAELGYDPYGYPQGWTGPRAVDSSWTPRTFWEERNRTSTRRQQPETAVDDLGVRWHSNPTRRGKRVAATPELVEQWICQAWRELGPQRSGYAELTYLRPRVQELAVQAGVRVAEGEDQALRQVVDNVLIAMVKTGNAHLVPDSSAARNHPVHKAAAIMVGGQRKNWFLIESAYFEASGQCQTSGGRRPR